jgi:hypothetical protein
MLSVVFGSKEEALRAQSMLEQEGFDRDAIVVSIDMTEDPIAAEWPGQSFENQPTHEGAGLAKWIKSVFTTTSDNDTSDAQRMAEVQRGGAVLSLRATDAELARAEAVLQQHHPLSLQRR